MREQISYAYRPIAEYVGGKYGLRIYQYGTQFRTTGSVIQIPNPPPGMEDEFAPAILGGILHEAWHVKNSAMEVMAKSKTDKKFNLVNMIEDMRDEFNLIKEYAGGWSILNRFNEYIKQCVLKRLAQIEQVKAMGQSIPQKMKLKGMVILGIAMNDRVCGYKNDSVIYGKEVEHIVDACQDILEEIKALGPGKEKTEATLDLSVKLYQRLANILPKPQPGDNENDNSLDINIPRSALDNEDDDIEDEEDNTSSTKKNKSKNKGGKWSENEEKEVENEQEDKTRERKKSKKGKKTNREEEREDSEEGNDEAKDDNGGAGGKADGDKERSHTDREDDDEIETNESKGKGKGDEESESNSEENDGWESGDDVEGVGIDSETEEIDKKDPQPGDVSFEDTEFWEEIRDNLIDDPEEVQNRDDVLNDFIEEDLRLAIQSSQRHIPYPLITKHDVCIQPTPSKTSLSFGNAYSSIKDRVAPQIGILQGRLLPLLVSENKGGFLVDQEEGDIDDSRLYMVRSGYERIYRKKVPRKDINTAIIFLGDVSGSMSGSPLNQVQRCFVVCGETCETLRIPYELLTFTTAASRNWTIFQNAVDNGVSDTYNRYEPLKHVIIKSFEEKLIDIKWRIVSMRPENYNCDPEALWWARERIMYRKEKRKIIFMMHDGFPNLTYGSHDRLNNELRIAIETLESSGIEVYGIGIMTDVPRMFYAKERCLVIMNDNQIAESIYKLLDKKLREG